MLRLCPALEARISDLRRDNTAAARFLRKAQVQLVSRSAQSIPPRSHAYPMRQKSKSVATRGVFTQLSLLFWRGSNESEAVPELQQQQL